MNKVFSFTNKETIYRRCILASTVHAVMNGRFEEFAGEQSWDGMNYSFQNFEGIRGTISFCDERFVCAVRNDKNYIAGEDEILNFFFRNADKKTLDIAADITLQYLLTDEKGNDVPAVSVAFWGNKETIFSNQQENEINEKSEGILLPIFYEETDALKYWKEYNDLNDESDNDKIGFIMEIYNKRINTGDRIVLDKLMKDKLVFWFGDNIDECIISFEELNVFFE